MPDERISSGRSPDLRRAGAWAQHRGRLRIARQDRHVHPPPLAPGARPGAAVRVALVQQEGDDHRLVSAFRTLATAAGAHVEWSTRRGRTADLLASALSGHDAVVTDRPPRLGRGERALLPRFHSVVRAPSAFGSSAAPRSIRRVDLLLVGAAGESTAALRSSVRLATEWARAEARRSIGCVGRELRHAAAALAVESPLRSLAAAPLDVRALAVSQASLRHLLFFEPHEIEAVVARAGELDVLARAACAGVGWSNCVPEIWVGGGRALVALGAFASLRRSALTAESAVAVARATERLLRHFGEVAAAARLGAALAAELGERVETSNDLWLDLASDTVEGFVASVAARVAPVGGAGAGLTSARDARSSRRAALG